jgi:hypothetical protein
MSDRQAASLCNIRFGEHAITALHNIIPLSRHSSHSTPKLPRTSSARLSEASTTQSPPQLSPEKTILYLAYGSNLSAETFKGTRGIKPLSAINVHVPNLDLTFDLAGMPYIEPCFANTRYRTQSQPSSENEEPSRSPNDYHKDRWHKGLIGVVYEVTPEDYRTIIATEGGGASYQDVVVPCYVLPDDSKTVDPQPRGPPFKAHTLLSPGSGGGRITRPDPSYAQASARYLKLLTDGAEEHNLPDEYVAYLYKLRPYTITMIRQRAGQVLFLATWFPIVIAMVGITRLFVDEDGKIPKWLVKVMDFVFRVLWKTYDRGFKPVFGDGERTIEDSDGGTEERTVGIRWCEKSVRLDTA